MRGSFLLPSNAGGASADWVNAVRTALYNTQSSINFTAPPTGLLAMPMSSSRIDLSWTHSGSQTGFKVERKTGAAGTWAQVALVASSARAHSDTTVAGNTTYFYRVRATNGSSD